MALLVLHPARLALIFFFALLLLLLAFAGVVNNWHRVGALYRRAFSHSSRERQFLAAVSFYLSFAIVRHITYAIHSGSSSFHNIEMGGRHIHHLVFGILILLAVGYGWLAGLGAGSGSRLSSRLMAIFYGIGAALTLDEFALWLNLQDVYWTREGRASVDAVFLFAAFMLCGLLGIRFFRMLARDALKTVSILRRRGAGGASKD
jgi:hypothetical protein